MTEPASANQDASERLYLEFAQAVLGRLAEYARTEGIPQGEGSFLEFIENGCRDRTFRFPNYWQLYQARMEEIIGKTEPADRCVRHYLGGGTLPAPSLADNAGNPILHPTEEQILPWGYRELLLPLMEAVGREQTFALTPEQIHACYRRFQERSRPRPPIMPIEVSLPLVNFATNLPITRVGRMLNVEPLSPEQKTDLWNRTFAPVLLEGRAGPSALIGSRFMLRGAYDHTAGETILEQPIFGDARRVVTALRLLKPGAVGVFAHLVGGREDHTAFASHPAELSARFPGDSYTLDASDVPPLQELIQRLQQKEDGLRIALRRFNQGYGRESGEDRIIDYAIALESCLLRGTGGQLSYRFSLRGAALLADSAPPRATRDILDAIYQARNQIVHGGGELSKLGEGLRRNLRECSPSVEVSQLPQRCEDVTRDVLRAYVRRLGAEASVEAVNRALDDRIADALRPGSA